MDRKFEQKLRDVTQKIIKAYNPERIILFGSFAYGEPTEDSDVDLLIIMDSDERPAVRSSRISKLLRPRPFPMDILVRTPQEIQHRRNMSDHFIEEILERGKTLYERRTAE